MAAIRRVLGGSGIVFVGVVVGLLVGSPRPAGAFGFDGAAIVAAVNSMSKLMNGAIGQVQKAVQSGLSSLNSLTGNGFTQLSNNLKAQIGAQEQIANANNIVEAETLRGFRNAQVRDDHTANREDCLNLQGGQAQVIAVRNQQQVASALGAGNTLRSIGAPGYPAWEGSARSAQASNQAHFASYCDDADAEAGLCTGVQGDMKDADTLTTKILDTPTLDQAGDRDAANAYLRNLIQPVAPAPLRNDERKSAAGQNMLPQRRSYDSAMALASRIGADVFSWHTPTVALTAAQKQEAEHEGLLATGQASNWEVTELEVNRRYSGQQWQMDLQAMPPKSVMVQLALLQAQQNWLTWQRMKLEQQVALAVAKLVASGAEDHLAHPPTMPTPEIQ